MAVPAGYFYKDGAYWNVNGSGPYGVTPGGAAILIGTAAALNAGQFNVGILGDSNTHNGYYTDGAAPDGVALPSYFQDTATTNTARGMGWSTWLEPLSLGYIRVVKSWARQTNGFLAPGSAPAGWPISAQITQMLADPLYSQVDRVLLATPINDTSFTLAAWTTEVLAQLARINKPVDIMPPSPRNDAVATTVNAEGIQGSSWFIQAGSILKRICAASGGKCRYIDTYSKLNMPTTNPDGLAAANAHPDTVHHSNVAAFLYAQKYIAATLSVALVDALDLWPHNSYASSANSALLDQAFSNPLMQGTGGTKATASITGTVPNGITVTGIGNVATGASGAGAVCSIIANPNGLGNLLRVVVTSAAAGDGVDIAVTSSMHASGGTFISPGDRFAAQALMWLRVGGIFPRNLYSRILGFVNPTNYTGGLFEPPTNASDERALPITADTPLLLRTPEVIAPAGAFTSLTWKVRPVFAAAGIGTLDVGNIDVRRSKAAAVFA